MTCRPAEPSGSLAAGGGAFLLVTGAAWGARRALYPGAEALFLLALILPLLRHRDALRRSRAFSWRCLGEAGVWGALLVVLPSLAVALAVTWEHRMLLMPPLGEGGLFLLTAVAVHLPGALGEELFFRGYLQEEIFARCGGAQGFAFGFSRKNVAASLLFALGHLLSRGSWVLVGLILPSLLLGRLVERHRGSVVAAALLHALGNAVLAWGKILVRSNFPPFF